MFKDEEPDNYTQLQEMSKELLLLQDGSLDPYVKNAIQIFSKDRNLFEELESFVGDDLDNFGYVGYSLDLYKIDMEVEKLITKLNASVDHIVEENLKELLEEFLDDLQGNSVYRYGNAKQKLHQSLRWQKTKISNEKSGEFYREY